jgi:DNA adenine methylase
VRVKSSKPFIRYVGGKSWFLKHYFQLFPQIINNYHEPFLGSGSIFFHLKSLDLIDKISYISDINSDLITTFDQVRENTAGLIDNFLLLENTKETFYKIRDAKPNNNLEAATRFLYLNRTSFGGIYRVNKNGEYNVPYGNRQYKKFIDKENLENCARLLKTDTQLESLCFTQKKYTIYEDDFFCLDPPYLGVNSPFNRYNKKKFGFSEVEHLVGVLENITKNKAKFLLFVGDNEEFISEIKHLGQHQTLLRTNNLSSNKSSGTSKEIIFKNY